MIALYAATSVCSFVSSASVQWRETVETSKKSPHSALSCANGARSSVGFTAMTTVGSVPSPAESASPSAARLPRENAARLLVNLDLGFCRRRPLNGSELIPCRSGTGIPATEMQLAG